MSKDITLVFPASRKRILKNIKHVAKTLKLIPVVHKVEIVSWEDSDVLIDIEVYPTLATFLAKKLRDEYGPASFFLKTSGRVEFVDEPVEEGLDAIFDEWRKLEYDDLLLFILSLKELSEKYEKVIPKV